jgi:hypothetical protein
MLTTFVISVVAILVFIILMAVGVMIGREPLKGSCGGLNKLGLRDGDCPVCGGNPAKCDTESDKTAPLARNAMNDQR